MPNNKIKTNDSHKKKLKLFLAELLLVNLKRLILKLSFSLETNSNISGFVLNRSLCFKVSCGNLWVVVKNARPYWWLIVFFSIEHVLQDLNQGGNNHIYPLVDPNVEFCGSNNLAYISSSRAKSEVRLILSRGLFIQSQNELP